MFLRYDGRFGYARVEDNYQASCIRLPSQPYYLFALQVGSRDLSSMACDVDPSRSTRVEVECSRSFEEHCLPSQFSKPYLIYSTTNATSVAINFAKGSLEDGVVNSPPSWDAARLPVCSPSPLQGYGSIPIR